MVEKVFSVTLVLWACSDFSVFKEGVHVNCTVTENSLKV